MRKAVKILLAAAFAAIAAAGCFYAYRKHRADAPRIEPDPHIYPTRGIDVSAHNGDIDFNRVRDDGYSFVLIKATEGTDFQDRNFVDNIRKARQAGLRVGAYHFFRFDTDGNLQALNLLQALRYRYLDFPAIIDVEEWGNPDDGSETSAIVSRLRQMIERLERHGRDVIIYANKDSYRRFIRGNFDSYPLWLCSFTPLDPDLDCQIWQYTHSGSVDGISGPVDLNAMPD